MSLREQLPSMATLGNAAAGFVACACVVAGKPELAALTILVAVLMDSLDGALARSLDAVSDFGAELDSLADVVSFGVAPALLAGSLLPSAGRAAMWGVVAIYPLCAAWRLARYNVANGEDGEEHGSFCGLPSTGAGAAAATAAMLYLRLSDHVALLGPAFMPCVMALLGALMVSRLPYKRAGAVIGRLDPRLAVVLAGAFVIGSILWSYEYLFGALMWSYVLSAPLLTATQKIRAVRHA